MSSSFERKEPKKRIIIKRKPIFVIPNEGIMEPDKKLSIKRLRREHRKNIKHILNEE